MTFENFPGMLGLPEGCHRATPIVGEKLNLGIFFKILFAWSSLYPSKII